MTRNPVPRISEPAYASTVVAGPAEGRDPAIHVDGPDKHGHDEQGASRLILQSKRVLALLVLAVLCLVNAPALAVRPDEMLADPVLEARAREIGSELRCLVCRNQSIDDSDADLAHDLRVLVRERLKNGDSNDQVIAYIRSRYGDFVLLRPPVDTATLLLWGGPALLLALGGIAIYRFYRRPAVPEAPPLSGEEHRRLAAVLGEDGGR